MYYDINYKRKSDHVVKNWKNISKGELEWAIKQLKYMATTFNWDIVLWIEDLDYLEIEERNYAYYSGGEYYFSYHTHHPQTWEMIETFVPAEQLKDMWYDDIIPDSYHQSDVTNEILHKYQISWDDYLKIWKVLFADNVITANTFSFELDEWWKICELFDLLFRIQGLYKKLEFTYDELKDIYKNWKIKYKKLEIYDLNEFSINDIVWKKLNHIKHIAWMKDKILKVKPSKISIRQETATK